MKTSKAMSLALCTIACLAAGTAFAAPPSSLPTVVQTLETTSKSINASMTVLAVKTLSAALLLQWLFTHSKQLLSGDMSATLAKTVLAITWGGAAFWAMGNQTILSDMFKGYLTLTTGFSGINFDAAAIWHNGVKLQDNMVAAFNAGTGADSLIGAIKNFGPVLVLTVACLCILIAYGVIAFSVLMATAEFWLMFAVVPIAIGMIGLNAFRDQGMAPLKGVISLGMRILILGLIVKILGEVQQIATDSFLNLPTDDPMETVWYALGGVFACAMMAINAGKIAAAIASGSSSFSGADAISGGLQMANVAAPVVAPAAAAVTTAGKAVLGVATGAAAGAAAGAAMGGATAAFDKATGRGLGMSQALGGAPGGGGASVIGGPIPTSSGSKPQLVDGKNAFTNLAEVGQNGMKAFGNDSHAVSISMDTKGE